LYRSRRPLSDLGPACAKNRHRLRQHEKMRKAEDSNLKISRGSSLNHPRGYSRAQPRYLPCSVSTARRVSTLGETSVVCERCGNGWDYTVCSTSFGCRTRRLASAVSTLSTQPLRGANHV